MNCSVWQPPVGSSIRKIPFQDILCLVRDDRKSVLWFLHGFRGYWTVNELWTQCCDYFLEIEKTEGLRELWFEFLSLWVRQRPQQFVDIDFSLNILRFLRIYDDHKSFKEPARLLLVLLRDNSRFKSSTEVKRRLLNGEHSIDITPLDLLIEKVFQPTMQSPPSHLSPSQISVKKRSPRLVGNGSQSSRVSPLYVAKSFSPTSSPPTPATSPPPAICSSAPSQNLLSLVNGTGDWLENLVHKGMVEEGASSPKPTVPQGSQFPTRRTKSDPLDASKERSVHSPPEIEIQMVRQKKEEKERKKSRSHHMERKRELTEEEKAEKKLRKMAKKIMKEKGEKRKPQLQIQFVANKDNRFQKKAKSKTEFFQEVLKQYSPKEIAIGITYLIGNCYCQIQEQDLLDCNWEREKSSVIHELATLFNNIAYMVSFDSLNRSSQEIPKALIFHIRVANFLEKLNNFDGLAAILAGLHNLGIQRLKMFWQSIPSKYQKKVQKYEKMMTPENNYRNYKKNLAAAQESGFVIPFLAPTLRELRFLYEGNSKYQQEHQGGKPKSEDLPIQRAVADLGDEGEDDLQIRLKFVRTLKPFRNRSMSAGVGNPPPQINLWTLLSSGKLVHELLRYQLSLGDIRQNPFFLSHVTEAEMTNVGFMSFLKQLEVEEDHEEELYQLSLRHHPLRLD